MEAKEKLQILQANLESVVEQLEVKTHLAVKETAETGKQRELVLQLTKKLDVRHPMRRTLHALDIAIE